MPRVRATAKVRRRGLWWAVSLTVVLVSMFGGTGPVSAESSTSSDQIRWSVVPANAEGPDGRRVVEYEVDPGEVAKEYLAVRNLSDQDITFRLAAADGFYTRAGRFDTLAADEASVALGSWITIEEKVIVPAHGNVVVPYNITVPDRAEPGDYAAGITASVLSVHAAEDGTNVGVETRVGFRVTARVTGALTPAARVHDLSVDYAVSWNPLRPGGATATFDVTNEGNTRLLTHGQVTIAGQRISFPLDGEEPVELLPGDTRTLTVDVAGVWPLFLVAADVAFTPDVMTLTGTPGTLPPVAAEAVFWAFPASQLTVFLGVGLLVLSIVWGRVRRRRHLAAMLETAREQGRQDVVSESPAR